MARTEWTLDHTGLTTDERVLRRDGTPTSPKGNWSFDQRTGYYQEVRADGRRLGIQAVPIRRGLSRVAMRLELAAGQVLESLQR
jgi:hypothetical protein